MKKEAKIRAEVRKQTLTEANRAAIAKIFARGRQIGAEVNVPPEVTVYAGYGRK